MSGTTPRFNGEAWKAALVETIQEINLALPLVDCLWRGDLAASKEVRLHQSPYPFPGEGTYADDPVTVENVDCFALAIKDIEAAQQTRESMIGEMRLLITAFNNTTEAAILAAHTLAGTTLPIEEHTDCPEHPMASAFYKARRKFMGRDSRVIAPSRRRYWAIVDPDTSGELLMDTERFVRAAELGDTMIQEYELNGETLIRTARDTPGFLGLYLGFQVYETPHIPIADGRKNLLLGDGPAINYVAQVTAMGVEPIGGEWRLLGGLCHGAFVQAENACRLARITAPLER